MPQKNSKLANEFLRAFSKSVNFRRMQAGNYVAIKYRQRIRMGEYYGVPQVIAAMAEVGKKKFFIFKNEKDGRFYNEKGKSLTSYIFKTPVRYTRISSKFTKKRWHPVLKRYRAHLGVDYAAPRGRPIYAAADGRIIHRGRKGGYGKTIIIQHKYGYKTLYAHQSRYKGGLRVGSRVRKGQHIGYVGSTGVSSGPHLHLGLYKNGRAINPLRIIRITKSKLKGKAKRKFLAHTKVLSKELLDTMKNNSEPFKLEKINPKTLLAKTSGE
jgi:murein DD-endopeptidase MepM/ murein hydrolase activator NlpD